ncbi:MAG TPA: hypothetical protein VFA75_05265 [Nevskia sp.]|nr:hypothetical protein [Nevskia sp.]
MAKQAQEQQPGPEPTQVFFSMSGTYVIPPDTPAAALSADAGMLLQNASAMIDLVLLHIEGQDVVTSAALYGARNLVDMARNLRNAEELMR